MSERNLNFFLNMARRYDIQYGVRNESLVKVIKDKLHGLNKSKMSEQDRDSIYLIGSLLGMLEERAGGGTFVWVEHLVRASDKERGRKE